MTMRIERKVEVIFRPAGPPVKNFLTVQYEIRVDGVTRNTETIAMYLTEEGSDILTCRYTLEVTDNDLKIAKPKKIQDLIWGKWLAIKSGKQK